MNFNEIFAPELWLSEAGGPRYIQLKRHLQSAIESQQLPPGTPLPPEREVARMTGLSRVTIRKAVAPLVEIGLIEQKQGSGTAVAAPITRVEQSLSRLTSFTEDMARRGMKVTSTFLSRGIFLPSPEEIMTLGLSARDSVARLERLRLANGTPVAIERASLPTDVLPNPLEVEESLYELLKKTGNKPVRAVQHIIATNLLAPDAALLDVDEGIAALQISRVSYLPSGKIAEFTRSLYRGDAYDFVAELQIAESG
ncbi:GntR family transcriptional regulator [Ponticoccus sp. SC2-23]|uniref:GntR family transcriptional regulator n=1 Tax=Alexandriicola marinus TaxID=2081710 RepID=UPI000FD8C593|nr:GntR family transcriptional regulator [Alexandriicola marinus]MBM1218610.1 GntR family transcriptional regulator [Ponticoccus sp. SC6-9]MBM1224318.1 GntR family transcriptional regulator [Ponticoccus sp. SC6-15]MBM1229903.1 GntR family transcriptional regulator [Ponticoccus sp. SC6-38]MBM1233284.1 GntR family transcriptional regulator [Ponticoccus sp. SC6-45]MBM1236766.1 GntR family transcriptional regulator [Ponticoccus sp. SC6-49]MBM1242295.1 GntR family transcriptional regulator [Pontic